MVEAARRKLARKGCDLIVANDVSRADAGFESDRNAVWFVWPGGDVEELPLLAKDEVARAPPRPHREAPRGAPVSRPAAPALVARRARPRRLALAAAAPPRSAAPAGGAAGAARCNVARIAGSINPASSDYLQRVDPRERERGRGAPGDRARHARRPRRLHEGHHPGDAQRARADRRCTSRRRARGRARRARSSRSRRTSRRWRPARASAPRTRSASAAAAAQADEKGGERHRGAEGREPARRLHRVDREASATATSSGR